MNSRERIEKTLNHQEPDCIPSDLGATVMTSLHVNAYKNLRKYLGLPAVNIRLADVVQQLVVVDDDVRDMLRVDTRGINPGPSRFAANIAIHEEMDQYRHFYDEWGIGWKMPKED